MSIRIGLFTRRAKKKEGQASTTATYVEVSNLAELAAKVAGLGAKEVGLLRRDRAGTTTLEGKMFPAGELAASHFEWLSAKGTEFETRGLFYD